MHKTSAFLTLLLSAASAQTEIGCFVSGFCDGADLVSFSNEADADACHKFCFETPDCDYWTFYTDDGMCLNYKDTCDLQQSSDAISGDVSIYRK